MKKSHVIGMLGLSFFVMTVFSMLFSPTAFLITPKEAQEACESRGDTWNGSSCESNISKSASPQQRACESIAGKWDGKKCNDNTANGPTLPATVKAAVNILLFIIGVTAVIVIVVQAFRFVNSNGDTAATSKAKNGIIFACIGLAVAFMAYAIVNFVLDQL